tara:strand:+ start:6688 stop:7353 length:666 start_codon:yes stop_codon:yes gene_type:complete
MTHQLVVFDLDDTLIGRDSGSLWLDFLVEKKIIKQANFLEQAADFGKEYAHGRLDMPAYLRFSLAPLAHISIAQIQQWVEEYITERIEPVMYPQAQALIKQLTQAGTPMLIISASVSFIVQPIGKRMGVEDALGIDLVEKNNCYTPEILGEMSFREGKVTRLESWLKERNLRFDEIIFYTDSFNDLPLCEYADVVHMINPCDKLAEAGQKQAWHTHHWQLA